MVILAVALSRQQCHDDYVFGGASFGVEDGSRASVDVTADKIGVKRSL